MKLFLSFITFLINQSWVFFTLMGVNIYQITLKDICYVNMEGGTLILTYICKFANLTHLNWFLSVLSSKGLCSDNILDRTGKNEE